MNFLQYKTPKELYQATGLTVQQALQQVEEELKKIGEENEEERRSKRRLV